MQTPLGGGWEERTWEGEGQEVGFPESPTFHLLVRNGSQSHTWHRHDWVSRTLGPSPNKTEEGMPAFVPAQIISCSHVDVNIMVSISWTPRLVVCELECASEWPGGLVKAECWDPPPPPFWFSGAGWGLRRICIFNKFSRDSHWPRQCLPHSKGSINDGINSIRHGGFF